MAGHNIYSGQILDSVVPQGSVEPLYVFTLFFAECAHILFLLVFSQNAHKMHLPAWVTPQVMIQLKQLKDFSFEFLFGIHKRVEKARLQGGK